MVIVKIKIVVQGNQNVFNSIDQIQARLEALPAAPGVKSSALFALVHCSDQSAPLSDTYHYVDTEWIDDKGAQVGKRDGRQIKYIEVTYDCTLPLEGAQ